MKKLISCLIALAFLSAAMVCLAGCGPDYRPNFVGTWRVTSMTDPSGEDLTPTIDQLAAANRHFTLDLVEAEDAASFDLAGQITLSGTWKPSAEDSCVISFEGYEDIPATLSEDQLTFEQGGQTMTCTKLE